MIEVKIRPDEITLFGHANYAVAGQDIVCAGATKGGEKNAGNSNTRIQRH